MNNIKLDSWSDKALSVEADLNSIIIGQWSAIRLLLITVFARGHVLLEGDVGVGKTTMLRALSHVIGGSYERVEGTIDLMPNDLLYSTYIDGNGTPVMKPGPVIRHDENLTTLFFNEINRARPQVHSLLLRIMAERSTQAFDKSYQFPHMLVFADRNQIEREETFELPAAARDRFFFELNIAMPDDNELMHELAFETRFHNTDELIGSIETGRIEYTQLNDIAKKIQSEITISDEIKRYILALCHALRYPDKSVLQNLDIDDKQLVKAGVSPRGISMLVQAVKVSAWLHGRTFVTPENIHEVLYASMAHRVFLSPAYEYRRDEIVPQLFEQTVNSIPSP